jgi:glycogen(starch) synthase
MIEPTSVKRVLMTGDTVGGVWTFTLELAEAVGPHGVEVVLATMGGQPSAEQLKDAWRIPNLRLFPSDFKLEWMNDPWRDVEASGLWLRELEARFTPDVIHLNTYGHGAVEWNAPVVLTAHSCVLSWWRAVHGEPAPAAWEPYRRAVVNALQSARLVTAPSRFMLRSLEENYGPHCRGTVIANGRNPAMFQPLPKKPFVLTAGRLWDEGKNIAVLAAIADALPWPVFVAGEPRHPDGGSFDLGGCRPLGRLSLSGLSQRYGLAAVYASPARYEPFGLSVLEAGLSGCALVLGDIPSLREIWQDAAVFVSPEEPGAWTGALRALAVDSRARCDLGLRARRRALEFSPGRMAQAYASCYRQAARQPEGVCAS